MNTPHLLQVGFTSANSEAAAGFYCQRLGFDPPEQLLIEAGPYGRLIGLPNASLKLLRLQLNDACLEILEVLEAGSSERPGRDIPADSRSCDLWFQHICLVTGDLDLALRQLQPALEHGDARAISSAPQTLPAWNKAAAGIRAYKFRDPEGHNLELLQFPDDKGDARWHQNGATPETTVQRPLLGIDHSAISVADTGTSCRFYDELLGLRLGGDGINSGPTQDALDGLEHTQVRITGHRCATGAGIECLNYLPPNQGRPMPQDLSAADLSHWQIRLAVEDLEAIAASIASYGGRVISEGIVAMEHQSETLGFARGLQVADPDGHRLQLVDVR